MNQRNSSKVNLVRSFNRPQVVIPGIGKPEPVGPIKENARKRLERKEKEDEVQRTKHRTESKDS